MSAATGAGTARRGAPLPWVDILLSAVAAVSWALAGMTATAALGLHLIRADAAGSLGPMAAAVVALGAGGSVTPSGDVSAFGLEGAEAHTAVEITPLGVSLTGALLLSWFFLRSLRTAGVVIAPNELLARAGTVVALFVAMLGGLARVGHDVVTVDGGRLGLDGPPGGGGTGVPGLGGLGDLGGLLPDRVGDLIHAKATVGFTVDTAPTLLGGLAWSAGVLLLALLASRRTPLPPGWDALNRSVRPAVSALVTVLLLAAAAGLAAAVYAAIGDDHPGRITGAALLGAPNGAWLGVPLGLFVPWDGRATGALGGVLPHPLDRLLSATRDQPVTLGRLAGLDGRVWLLTVAAASAMLLAGVLTAVRTPVPGGTRAAGLAGRCALRLGLVTALAWPLTAWLTDVSAHASLSVLGFDAFGTGVELHGRTGPALLLGAVWGAGAGAAGALLARALGAAGTRVAGPARDGTAGAGGAGAGYGAPAWDGAGHGRSGHAPYGDGRSGPPAPGDGRPGWPSPGGGPTQPSSGGAAGPYAPGRPYRPPDPGTNPYLRMPQEVPAEPEDGRPPSAGDDMYGAPTVSGRLDAPRGRGPGRPPRRSPHGPDDGAPPPPPPPPPHPPPPPPPPPPPRPGTGR
ncbi:streptophobe family protein [Streptomyces sp. NPDC059168]|uniref:streptophobe family protein n=1 Tax=Streptomyces sp. NPDC059168 TaxID=3346753 RepID=UPI0036B25E2D